MRLSFFGVTYLSEVRTSTNPAVEWDAFVYRALAVRATEGHPARASFTIGTTGSAPRDPYSNIHQEYFGIAITAIASTISTNTAPVEVSSLDFSRVAQAAEQHIREALERRGHCVDLMTISP